MGADERGGLSMRDRRGAIVVMTGIIIVALMIIAAITVDASRIFAAKNELQTAADAAALAGAIQLLDDSSTASDTARAYALRNRVELDSVDSVEVQPGVWRPHEQADLRFVPFGEPWDAVRVTTRHPLPLSLARVFGDSTVTVSATAIAWAAGPVMEARCLKPLAVPYARLLSLLGYSPTSDILLNEEDIRRLRDTSKAARSWHFHFGNQSNQRYHDWDDEYGDDHFTRDQYFPIDIDSAWVPNGPDGPNTFSRPSVDPSVYQSYLAGGPTGRCSQKVRPGNRVRAEPEPKLEATRDGLAGICQSLGGTFVRVGDVYRCESEGEVIGLPLRVVYWSGPVPTSEAPGWYNSGQSAELITRMTGWFVVDSLNWMEPVPGGGDPNDDDDDDNNNNNTWRSQGKMHGYFDVRRDFGVVDETVASTLLRPVLVR
jgi:Flp pilus assembly protein TadG